MKVFAKSNGLAEENYFDVDEWILLTSDALTSHREEEEDEEGGFKAEEEELLRALILA